jgi:hypothetical protein
LEWKGNTKGKRIGMGREWEWKENREMKRKGMERE